MIRGLVFTWMVGALGAASSGGTPGVLAASSAPAATLARVMKSSRATLASMRRNLGKRPVRTLRQGRFVAQRAVSLVGEPTLAVYQVPNDCSGLVRVAYQSVGVELLSHGALPGENAVSAIYRRAEDAGAVHRDTPQPGDLIFFRDTYDRTRDGLRNDGLTHIGIVERVGRDGTVTFVHRVNRGVRRARMNPGFPSLRRDRGLVFNETLRKASGTEGARTTGELFVAYASSSRM